MKCCTAVRTRVRPDGLPFDDWSDDRSYARYGQCGGSASAAPPYGDLDHDPDTATKRGIDFTSDPTGELIAATSVVEQIPLLTRDPRILESNMVPFAS